MQQQKTEEELGYVPISNFEITDRDLKALCSSATGRKLRPVQAIEFDAPLSHERFEFDHVSAGTHFFHPSVTRMGFFGNRNQTGFTERRNVARHCAAVALHRLRDRCDRSGFLLDHSEQCQPRRSQDREHIRRILETDNEAFRNGLAGIGEPCQLARPAKEVIESFDLH